MNIIIHPIGRLMEILKDKPARAVAIISSAYPVEESHIPIAHLVEIYEDLDREVLGRSLSPQGAERIANFIKSLDGQVDTVYCACNMGVRRSSAIAAAVHMYFGMDDMHIWENPHFQPNPLVFQMVCTALGIALSDDMLDLRLESNFFAFRNAIKNASS